MRTKFILAIFLLTILYSFQSFGFTNNPRFNSDKDLLLVNFDCKTDVDDLHTVAALATLMSNAEFSKIKYHAVAGTYGIQEGLYVPPNPLFELAFDQNWTDAHENIPGAVSKVMPLVNQILAGKGDIWIADAGQSDFSAALVKAIQAQQPRLNTRKRIHIVQHSDWNEEVTDPEKLKFVKENTDYHKIPDGNAVGNGTPGFRDPNFRDWDKKVKNQQLNAVWKLSTDISNQYNGKDGRYNNEAIEAGGLDFSDLSEVCYILGLESINDADEFFERYGH
ncbi:hypothetical protein ACFOSV_06665 [Algoriphagus namhaensis]|uniref:DUF1194 domain-containing protein n=1 Tax=Algoriphagus namhaensis TaxID=915353 RepID=A0ABV8AQG9_9BACT